MGDVERRRRRLRHQPEPEPAPRPGDGVATPRIHDGTPPPRGRRITGEDRESDRGLRGLVGSGSSQVGLSAALRARDAARPSAEELARAGERVVLVRRNWVPREDLPRSPR
jgi:hypothetical protein